MFQFGDYRDYVCDIAQDTNGDLWFATDGGLLSYTGSTWITYTVDDGLLSNTVRGIVIDDHGNNNIFLDDASVSTFQTLPY